ncbi:MAG: hypothetical protein QXF23_07215 [Candidatus Bathyarchaeia archaeon]
MLKMLLRKDDSFSAILSIALLVALIASTSSIANNLNLQVQALSRLVNVGGTIIITSRNASSLIDSKIGVEHAQELIIKLENLTCVKRLSMQKILSVQVFSSTKNATAYMRLVDDLPSFLKGRNARLNGTLASNRMEINMGEILAKILSVNVGDKVIIQHYESQVDLRVSGIFRSQTEIDSEVVASMKLLEELTLPREVSLIEVVLGERSRVQEALTQIGRILPENLIATQAQQLLEFTKQTIQQTLNFLDVWFTVVYIAIAITSYVIVNRLIAESSYELTMLKTLGAGKGLLSTSIVLYTMIVALAGSILGVAVGTVGAQVAATIFRWIKPSVIIEPTLELQQTVLIALLTLISSIAGCIFPALKNIQEKSLL